MRAAARAFFWFTGEKKHITINGDLPDVLQKVVLAHELGHCVLHSGSSSAAFHDVILFDTADQKGIRGQRLRLRTASPG